MKAAPATVDGTDGGRVVGSQGTAVPMVPDSRLPDGHQDVVVPGRAAPGEAYLGGSRPGEACPGAGRQAAARRAEEDRVGDRVPPVARGGRREPAADDREAVGRRPRATGHASACRPLVARPERAPGDRPARPGPRTSSEGPGTADETLTAGSPTAARIAAFRRLGRPPVRYESDALWEGGHRPCVACPSVGQPCPASTV